MSDKDCYERLTALETKIEIRVSDSINYRKKNDEILKEVLDCQDTILKYQANHSGFKNGAIFALSIISAMFGATVVEIVTYVIGKS